MNVMSAFVGIDGFEIHDVSDNVVFILDAIACNEVTIQPFFLNTKVFLGSKWTTYRQAYRDSSWQFPMPCHNCYVSKWKSFLEPTNLHP